MKYPIYLIILTIAICVAGILLYRGIERGRYIARVGNHAYILVQAGWIGRQCEQK
jgi:hypothetical protein